MGQRISHTRVVALPGWWSSVAQAEAQAARSLRGLPVRTACTHVVDGIALATAEVEVGGLPEQEPLGGDHSRWAVRAQEVVDDHASHFGGRLFVFPGQDRLGGTMTAAQVVRRSGVDELVVPGHPGPVDDAATVEGLDFVRPVYRQGKVVLTLRPVAPGRLSPFEGAPVRASRHAH